MQSYKSIAPLLLLAIISLVTNYVTCLKHHLVLTNDRRPYVLASTFGFLNRGRIRVIVENLTLSPDPTEEGDNDPEIGFMFIRTDRDANIELIYDYEYVCILNRRIEYDQNGKYGQMTMVLKPSESKVLVRCNSERDVMPIPVPMPEDPHHMRQKRAPNDHYKNNSALVTEVATNSTDHEASDYAEWKHLHHRDNALGPCRGNSSLPLMVHSNQDEPRMYSFNFSMTFNQHQEGFYWFTFQNCRGFSDLNRRESRVIFNLSLKIEEINYNKNYLSAGRMPLPQMYFMLSVMFLLLSCVWLSFINRQRESTLKIHHLMTVLVFFKSISLLIHAINYHYIAIYGQPVVTWAYIYYTTRSLKGALFFITLALIGSGWSFIKHILSNRDKKIIMIVVGLQVIAHIAEIVLDESIEGEPAYEFWGELATIVDLISCLAILYPIGYSVRHLEEASRTDGKAAINLKKIKLFKKFYIISTVYIYVTRIVSFVFVSTLTFRYVWLAELITEVSTLIYFIITGYYFQPLPTNPYLLLSSDNDLDEDILFSVDSTDVMDDKHPLERLDGSQDAKVTRRLIEEVV